MGEDDILLMNIKKSCWAGKELDKFCKTIQNKCRL